VGRWNIDPAHSDVQFVARHMMISKVRGHFREFEGWLDIAERPEDSSVEVTINAASIDTGDPERDGHLSSPDFLDVERYPAITYRSTALRPVDGERYEVVGDLAIRHVTRSVTLDVEFEGVAVDPGGGATTTPPRSGVPPPTRSTRRSATRRSTIAVCSHSTVTPTHSMPRCCSSRCFGSFPRTTHGSWQPCMPSPTSCRSTAC
jgi:polyisoprenoid-binding protein YceI